MALYGIREGSFKLPSKNSFVLPQRTLVLVQFAKMNGCFILKVAKRT